MVIITLCQAPPTMDSGIVFNCIRYLKSQEEAEDVVADCFEKLLKMSNENGRKKFIIDQIDLNSLLIVIVKTSAFDVENQENR
jgi:hypothetical protein